MSDRDLHNIDSETAKASTSDIKVTGNPDAWVVVCKASSKSQGWMKSTKRMEVADGYLYQVTTEHRDPETNKVLACAEAITFVPKALSDIS